MEFIMHAHLEREDKVGAVWELGVTCAERVRRRKVSELGIRKGEQSAAEQRIQATLVGILTNTCATQLFPHFPTF